MVITRKNDKICEFWDSICEMGQTILKKIKFLLFTHIAHQSTQNFKTNKFVCNVYVFYCVLTSLFAKKDFGDGLGRV